MSKRESKMCCQLWIWRMKAFSQGQSCHIFFQTLFIFFLINLRLSIIFIVFLLWHENPYTRYYYSYIKSSIRFSFLIFPSPRILSFLFLLLYNIIISLHFFSTYILCLFWLEESEKRKKKTRVWKKLSEQNGGDNSLSNRYRKETLVAHKP